MSKKPSEIRRDALRTICRNVADQPWANGFLAGRKVNDLTMAELERMATTYAPEALAAMVPATEAEPEPELLPIDSDTAPEPDPIEVEVAGIRSLVVSGGFMALDARLRDLVREARKPAVEIERIVERTVTIEAPPPGSRPVHVSQPTGSSVTWADAFEVPGALGRRTTALWDGTHPDVPRVNTRYVWPQPETAAALTQLARGRNIFLYGPAGTGKTEWSHQLAARLGRPFALVGCTESTDAATLTGMTTPANGATSWQDGQLTRAIRTPGCVVCIDEPSVARPGALMLLQNTLANRVLWHDETGMRVPVANGVVFVACDNTNGTGGGSRRGYTGTQRLNDAFLDRFGARVDFGWLPADREADVLVSYTGCTRALARLLVGAATTTRQAAEQETLSKGLGLRRLFAWAELLSDGIEAEQATRYAVLNSVPEAERETLQQQIALTVDSATVAAALADTSN